MHGVLNYKGAARLDPKLEFALKPLHPAGPKQATPASSRFELDSRFGGSVRHLFCVSFLVCLFSGILQNIDDFGSGLGPIWGQFSFNSATLFRILFRIRLFLRRASFYFGKTMIYGKTTQRLQFNTIFEFLIDLGIILGPRLE